MIPAAQRQRQLAAKAARRKAAVTGEKLLEASSASLSGRIAVAARGSFVRCTMSSTLFEVGIGHVIVARALPSGLLGCGYFLVDAFCLGIKDAFYNEIGHTELRSRLAELEEMQSFTDIEPAHARKLIRDAAAHAADLGLPAAKNTPTIEAIFGDVDAGTCTEAFTFGSDGKPLFIGGPNDTPGRSRATSQLLDKRHADHGWDQRDREVPSEISFHTSP